MLSSRTRRSGRGTSAPRCRDRGSYRHRARRLLQATFIAHWRGQGSDRSQDRSSVLQRFAIRTDYVDPRASYYETRYPTRVVNNLHGRAKALGFVLQALEPQVGAAVSYESFSSVNSPLLAFSDFTSTAGATARGAPRAEHVRSPALKLSFPGRHRMGWTSKCSANWAIVRSPFDGRKRHLRLESRAVAPARSSVQSQLFVAIIAAFRQKLQLSTCSNLRSRLLRRVAPGAWGTPRVQRAFFRRRLPSGGFALTTWHIPSFSTPCCRAAQALQASVPEKVDTNPHLTRNWPFRPPSETTAA